MVFVNNYERAKRKSVKVAAIEYNGERFKIDLDKLKKLLIAGTAAVTMTVTILTASVTNALNTVRDNMEVDEHLSQYRDIIVENTHRTSDNQHYWYDVDGIGREVAEDLNTAEDKLFAVYKDIGYNEANRDKHMDQVIDYLGEEYKTFDDYLKLKGFVDEKGNPSREVYEEYNTKRIAAELAKEKAELVKKK